MIRIIMNVIMPHSVLVITTAQLHSTKSEFRFSTGSNTAWACHQSLTMIPAGNKAKCLSSVKHTTKTIHHEKKVYAWNLTICACKSEKDCEIGEYLKDFTWMKNLVDDLVVTCDEIVDPPKTTLINSNDRTNCFIAVVYYYGCSSLLSIV